jgi:hypothetical protein
MRLIYLSVQLAFVLSSFTALAQVDLGSLITAGELTAAEHAIRAELVETPGLSPARQQELRDLLSSIQSVSAQFDVSYQQMFTELKERIPDLSPEDVSRWQKDNLLEYMLIDGEKRYFWAWQFNLFQLSQEARQRAGIAPEQAAGSRSDSLIQEVLTAADRSTTPFVCPRSIQVSFSYFEDVSGIPDGDVIRAWLPVARRNQFQGGIEIVKSSTADYLPPKPGYPVASVYFECPVNKRQANNAAWAAYFSKPDEAWIKPLKTGSYFTNNHQIHQIVFRYRAVGLYRDIDPASIQPWDDPEVEPYTREEGDIVFTPYLRQLVHGMVGDQANPYLQAKAIYEWICRNITWTNPVRTFDNPVERTARLRRGDCGAKARLFIALCRLEGIPARSQGGWRIEPGRRHSQHTWAQAYFAPYGWLPVDPDAGSHFIDHPSEKVRFFHFGNCLPYRLVTYDDDSPFFPLPIHPQAGDGGPQLGSFEWRGGSIETNVKIDTEVGAVPRGPPNRN